MENKIEQIKAFLADHQLSEASVRGAEWDGKHIAIIFSDGELCSTKAGYLLHQRTLHCFESGDESKRVDDEMFTQWMKEYGFAYMTHPNAEKLRELILG